MAMEGAAKNCLCQTCGKMFSSDTHVKRHFTEVHAEKPHKCDFCAAQFLYPWILSRHLAKFHKKFDLSEKLKLQGIKGSFKCVVCYKKFSMKPKFDEHMKMHEEGKWPECDCCHAVFKCKSYLDTHELSRRLSGVCPPVRIKEKPSTISHHEEAIVQVTNSGQSRKKVICPHCNKTYLKHHFAEHLRIHTGEKPLKCDHCEMRFRFSSEFRRHIKRRILLNKCPALQNSDAEVKNFECTICGKRFETKRLLTVHMGRHAKKNTDVQENCAQEILMNETSGDSKICIKTTSEHSQQVDTRNFDTTDRSSITGRNKGSECMGNESSTSCTMSVIQQQGKVCEKVMNENGKSAHTNDTSVLETENVGKQEIDIGKKSTIIYECSVCLKRFASKNSRQQHMRIHTNEMPFKCEHCEMKFWSSNGYYRHRRIRIKMKGCPVPRMSLVELVKKARVCGEKNDEGKQAKENLIDTSLVDGNSIKNSQEVEKQNFVDNNMSSNAENDNNEHMDNVQRGMKESGGKSWKCDVCGREFRLHGVFRNHMRLVHGRNLAEDQDYIEEYYVEEVLMNEKSVETVDGPKICDKIPPENSKEIEMRNACDNEERSEGKGHKRVLRYRCKHCSYSNCNKQHIQEHIKRHIDEKYCICDHCGMVMWKSSLKQHLKNIHKIHPAQDHDENATENFAKEISVDSKTKTDGNKDDSNFDRQKMNKRDVEDTGKTSSAKFECSICRIRVNTKRSLLEHSRIHTNERPLKCEHCQMKFRFSTSLYHHNKMRVKMKRCPVGKTSMFEQSENSLKFANENDEGKQAEENLIDSSRKNSYKCDLCGLVFKFPSVFRRHLNSVHRTVEDQDGINECYAGENLNEKAAETRGGSKNYEAIQSQVHPSADGKEVENTEGRPVTGKDNDLINKSIHNIKKSSSKAKSAESKTGFKDLIVVVRKLECAICRETIFHKSHIEKETIDTFEKPLKCDPCESAGKRFARKMLANKSLVNKSLSKDDTAEGYRHNLKGKKCITKKIECKICNKIFYQKPHYVEHIRIHSGEKPLKCGHCEMKFRFSASLRRHLRSVHKVCTKKSSNDEGMECKICNKTFNNSFHRMEHMRIHTGEKPMKCELCQRLFRFSATLRSHLKSVHKLCPVQIKIRTRDLIANENTGENFDEEISVNKLKVNRFISESHQIVKDTLSSDNECIDNDTRSTDMLSQNEDTTVCFIQSTDDSNSSKKKKECEICNKTFSQTGHYREHLRIHSGEMPLKCVHCEMKFRFSASLRKHLRSVHNDYSGRKRKRIRAIDKVDIDIAEGNVGEDISMNKLRANRFISESHQKVKDTLPRDNECIDNDTRSSDMLSQNEDTTVCYIQSTDDNSSSKKKKECEICNKTFSQTGHYREHMRIHSGEMPLTCVHCEMKFRFSASLRRHLRSVHNDCSGPKRKRIRAIDKVDIDIAEGNVGEDISVNKLRANRFISESHQKVKDNLPRDNECIDNDTRSTDMLSQHEDTTVCFTKSTDDNNSSTKRRECKIYKAMDKIDNDIPEGNFDDEISENEPTVESFNSESYHGDQDSMTNENECIDNVEVSTDRSSPNDTTESYTRSTDDNKLKRKKIECKICNKIFFNTGHYHEHMRIHSGEMPLKCDHCERKFRFSGSLRRHLKCVHNDFPLPKRIRAMDKIDDDIAEGNFEEEISENEPPVESLKSKSYHGDQDSMTNENEYIDNVEISTDRASPNDDPLLRYTLSTDDNNSNTKKIKCKICNKSFSQKDNYHEHIRIHSGEKPLKCDYCQMEFKYSSSLRRHLRSEVCTKKSSPNDDTTESYTRSTDDNKSKRKKIECKICNKTFSQTGHYHEHMRIHSGEMPLKCDYCERKFRFSCSLRRHLKCVHNDFPLPKRIRAMDKIDDDIAEGNFEEEISENEPPVESLKSKSYHGDQDSMTNENECIDNVEISTDRASPNDDTVLEYIQSTDGNVSNTKKIECKICNKSFSREAHCSEHIRIHTGEKPLTCQLCGKRFTFSSSLKRHLRSVHKRCVQKVKPVRKKRNCPSNKSKCPVCNITLISNSALQKHLRIHSGENPFRCDHCGLSFKGSSTFLRHARIRMLRNKCPSTQENTKTIICEICNKTISKYRHERHMRTHTNDKPLECEHCKKRFRHSSSLRKHLQIFHNEFPIRKVFRKCSDSNDKEDLTETFQCSVCKLTFSSKRDVQEHRKVHSEEKTTLCHHCGRKFKHFSTLKSHERTRRLLNRCPKVKSYVDPAKKTMKCTLCNNAYVQENHLLEHMRVHNNEKPLNCDHCEKKFRFSSSFRRHMITVHGVYPERTAFRKPKKSRVIKKIFVDGCGGELGGEPDKTVITEDNSDAQNSVKVLDSRDFENSSVKSIFWTKDNDDDCVDNTYRGPDDSSQNNSADVIRKEIIIDSKENLANKFECQVCHKFFLNVKEHMVTHTKEKPYKCYFCDEHFSYSASRERHIKRYHSQCTRPEPEIVCNEGKYLCSVCGKTFNRPSSLRKHMEMHTEKNYSCEFCHAQYKHTRGINNHLNLRKLRGTCPVRKPKDTEEKTSRKRKKKPMVPKFHCPYCNKSKAQLSHLTEHIRIHTGEKPLVCTCGMSFRQGAAFNRHIKNKLCHQPDWVRKRERIKKIKNREKLKEQELVNANRDNSANYRCTFCNETMSQISSLREHMRQHAGEKLYGCVCGKTFKYYSQLTKHIRNKVCPFPKRVMTTGGSIDEKTGKVAKFRCTFCNKPFFRLSYLELHMVVHTKERPFQCLFCGKKFGCHSNLKRHLGTVHKGHHFSHEDGKLLDLKGNETVVNNIPQEMLFNENIENRTRFEDPSIQSISENNTDNVLKYPCTYCNEAFFTLSDLQAHMVQHAKENPFQCTFCGLRFPHRVNVEQHLRTIHQNCNFSNGDGKFLGFTCDETVINNFPQEMLLNPENRIPPTSYSRYQYVSANNIESLILAGNEIECANEADNMTYFESSPENIEEFQTNSTENKPNLGLCTQTSSSSISQEHLKSTGKETSFQCDVCRVRFAHRPSMVRHVKFRALHGKCPAPRDRKDLKLRITKFRKKSGRQTCTVCNKSFRCASGLRDHMRGHTGEKPHKCDLCEINYRYKSSINRHMRTYHPDHIPDQEKAIYSSEDIAVVNDCVIDSAENEKMDGNTVIVHQPATSVFNTDIGGSSVVIPACNIGSGDNPDQGLIYSTANNIEILEINPDNASDNGNITTIILFE